MTETLRWWPDRLAPLVHYARDCQWWGLLADCYAEVRVVSHTVPNVWLRPWSRAVGPALAESLRVQKHVEATAGADGKPEAWRLVLDWEGRGL